MFILCYIGTANFRSYLNQFKEASAEINATVDEQGLHSIVTGMYSSLNCNWPALAFIQFVSFIF